MPYEASFGPINYSSQITPVDYVGSWDKGVNSDRNDIALQQAQQAQQQSQNQIPLQQQMKTLMAKPYVSSTDIAPILAQADPEHFKQFSGAFGALTEQQQQNKLAQIGQISSALQTKNPTQASTTARSYAEAFKNSGDTQSAQQFSALADHIDQDPGSANLAVSLLLGSVPGGNKVLDTVAKQAEVLHAQNMNPSLESTAKSNAITAGLTAANTPEKLDVENQDKLAQVEERRAIAISKLNAANGILAPNGKDYIAQYANQGVDTTRMLRTKDQQLQFQKNAQYAEENGTDFDPMAAARSLAQELSTGRSAGGTKVLNTRGTLENATALLGDMRKTVDDLDFTVSNKYAGDVEAWAKDALNDPTYTKFKTQKVDEIFNLTNALKLNGVTDQSLRMESEAMVKAMSPPMFKEWADVQEKALSRMTEQYNKNYGPRKDLSSVNTSSPTETKTVSKPGLSFMSILK